MLLFKQKINKLFNLKVFCFNKIDSTNRLAKQLAKKSGNNGLIIAKNQTLGVGRKSREFFCYKNGLYFSLFIKDIDNKNITPLCAVAVLRAIKKLNNNLCPKIKWVNDIYINNKKVCGILCEKCSDNNFTVIGIGVNTCKPKEVPQSIKDIFGYINEKPSKKYNQKLLKLILEEIFNLLKTNDFYEEYKNNSLIINKEISVILENESFSAKAIGFNDELNLIVLKDGEEVILNSGDVSLKI